MTETSSFHGQTTVASHRPLARQIGLLLCAVILISVSHVVAIHNGIYFPLISCGVLTGIGCGLAIWVCMGGGKWHVRMTKSILAVILLSGSTVVTWNLLPKWAVPNLTPWPDGPLSVGIAIGQSVLWYVLIWGPLQVAVCWFGWRNSASELRERDARAIRKRTLLTVSGVLMCALVVLRLAESGVTNLDQFRTMSTVAFLPVATMYGFAFASLVWGGLGTSRLRVAILACLPYLFLSFLAWHSFSPVFGWVGRWVVLAHIGIVMGSLIGFRTQGWRITPYSHDEIA